MAPGFLDLIRSDLDYVDQKVQRTFKLRPGHLSEFAHIETKSVQKYIHSALVLLVGRIYKYSQEKIIYLASVIQLIYLASSVQFGVPDDNEQEGEGLDVRDGSQYPVLVGDYLYGKYYVGLCEGGLLNLLKPLSEIIAEMNYGALIRKKNVAQTMPNSELALHIVEKETALLMQAAAKYAGVLADASVAEVNKLADLGFNLGMAYGILERNMGSDLAAPYFDAVESILKELPAGEARDNLAQMIRDIRNGIVTVPPQKTGPTFDSAEWENRDSQITEQYQENKEYVQSIFSAIAQKYDTINTVLSLNQDKYWRKFAVQQAKVKSGSKVLDVCCGTGMLTQELAKKVGSSGKVTGVDLNSEMLEIAKKNLKASPYEGTIDYIQGNALELPFPDNSFDCVTIGFGLRNVSDFKRALKEMTRVVKPGCRVVCLEFSKPSVPLFEQVYNFYFDKFVPFFDKLGVGKKGPYKFLHRAWKSFPHQKELRDIFTREGLENAVYYELTGGVISVHVGRKPMDCVIPSIAATKE